MSQNQSTIEKWRSLVDRIIYATNAGRISWKQSSEESVYTASVSGTQITYEQADNPDGINVDYVFKIYNPKGEVIDFFNDTDLFSRDPSINYYPRMRDLYNTIVRQTNGSDIVLDKLLSSLEYARDTF